MAANYNNSITYQNRDLQGEGEDEESDDSSYASSTDEEERLDRKVHEVN